VKLQLASSVSSLQDVTALLLEVHGYAKWFSQTEIKKQVHAEHMSEPPVLSPAASQLLQQVGSQQALDELIRALEELKNTAPSMTITLAAPAPGDLKQSLVAWCRENISPNILVNFRFNATILGGMVVRYGSHVFDWSFKRQLLANRAHFPEVLRRV
jgi:hypothetical protein